ncbi:hypothetical protein EMCRGX_G025878 [Ephydatia muelleri]
MVEGSWISRPADVLVDGWDRAKPAAFDVTVTSPLTPVTLNEASLHEGAAALAADRKHAANDARCQALGWSCIPLAVETFGNWGREAQCVFSRLATLLAIRQGRPKSSVVRDLYGCLSISLPLILALSDEDSAAVSIAKCSLGMPKPLEKLSLASLHAGLRKDLSTSAKE